MAASFFAAYEDHPRGHNPRELIGVMACHAYKLDRLKAQVPQSARSLFTDERWDFDGQFGCDLHYVHV
jgi:hypothetical protein